jgi:hypothetical protein
MPTDSKKQEQSVEINFFAYQNVDGNSFLGYEVSADSDIHAAVDHNSVKRVPATTACLSS